MLTSKELAKLIGVSQPTISRVLNGNPNVSPATREYVLQMVEKYGYTPSSAARMLKIRRTNMVGILFPKFFESHTKNMMFTYIYDFLQKELLANNYDVLLVYDQQDDKENNAFERIVKGRKIDGLIALRSMAGSKESQLLQEQQIPYVTAYHGNIGSRDISLDSEKAGRLAGEFFGRQEPCHYMAIMDRHNDIENARRLNGFRAGLGQYQRILKEDDIFYCDLSVSSAYDLVISHQERFMNRKISMLIYNDIIAIGALNAMRNLNIQVPEQIQTISFDGIPLGQSLHPRLTTLQAPVEDMVKYSVCTLINLMEKTEPRSRPTEPDILNYALIERETTRKDSSTLPVL